jgi:hypothetical protein
VVKKGSKILERIANGVNCLLKSAILWILRSVWPAVVKQFVEVASDYFISAIAGHPQ